MERGGSNISGSGNSVVKGCVGADSSRLEQKPSSNWLKQKVGKGMYWFTCERRAEWGLALCPPAFR